jgi:hypothetical protein
MHLSAVSMAGDRGGDEFGEVPTQLPVTSFSNMKLIQGLITVHLSLFS